MAAKEVSIRLRDANLGGQLDFGDDSRGLVLFAHGSGSSRHSPRNQHVARRIREKGLGTFLFDLMTADEEEAEAATRHLRFDIGFLADRLVHATLWAVDNVSSRDFPIGYFGSSTGAAAALVAASKLRDEVVAIVSRGGRPDLAGDALERVAAPTLLVVGGEDQPVIPLNEEAYDRLTCQKALRIVPGATHLFEEPGKLDIVAEMAGEWFANHFQPVAARPGDDLV